MDSVREVSRIQLHSAHYAIGGTSVPDEVQHLSTECLETIRELLDQPPHCDLLFAGTHELEEIFTRQVLELEQWRSRFHAGQSLPGISEEEATQIVRSDMSRQLSENQIRKLIAKSRIRPVDVYRRPGQRLSFGHRTSGHEADH
jgi:hypothetical protein